MVFFLKKIVIFENYFCIYDNLSNAKFKILI